MEVIHPRCAGIDCSKKDAKVCIRVQGHGWGEHSETVTTWGATTNQILALREHLIAPEVSCVMIEATSDYWKPFYYLLEDPGSRWCWSTPRRCATYPAARATSRTRPGWPSWAPTDW